MDKNSKTKSLLKKANEFLELFIKNKGFISKDIILKKTDEKGYFFLSKRKITKDSILILVPKNLLIPEKEIKNLKKFKNQFQKMYFNILMENKKNLSNHPLKTNFKEFKKILKTIQKNENLKRTFETKYNKFNKLSEEKQLIHLLSQTRSINLNNIDGKFFMPVLDFVNHGEFGTNYIQDKNLNVLIKANKDILPNEEILINYAYTDAITFYLNHGFIYDDFNTFKIKKNELNLNFEKDIKFNKNLFNKVGKTLKFNKNIIFTKNQIPNDFFSLLEIFPLELRFKRGNEILNYYKNAIEINEENKDVIKNSIKMKNFFKSANLYIKIINNYSKILNNNFIETQKNKAFIN